MDKESELHTRTSESHPLQIAELMIGDRGGAIGVTFAPGKQQAMAMTGSWSRDLDADLAAIKAWGGRTLVSLIEPWEFDDLRIAQLPQRALHHGIEWHGLPIVDGTAPDEHWLDAWKIVGKRLTDQLIGGSRVVVHCKGGLGRAGTVASMLLIQTGQVTDPELVMTSVRQARPGAIETKEQEEFIRRWAARVADGRRRSAP